MVGVILEKEGDIMIEISIKFDFPVSNNQAEYEALIIGLQLLLMSELLNLRSVVILIS